MKEKWKPIPTYEGIYEVSNIGRVRKVGTILTVDGTVAKDGAIEPFILKQHVTDTGYQAVMLMRNGKGRTRKVHRLVALAFIPWEINRGVVNHKDGNKLNNCVSNLEWCTSSENNKHAIDTGLRSYDKIRREYHVVYKEIDAVVKGAKQVAKLLHKHGYFTDVEEYNLKAAITQCALDHRFYLGVVKAEHTDDPYDIPKPYHRCGIKGRSISALADGVKIDAKGPAALAREMQSRGYWTDRTDFKKLVKRVSESALNSQNCYGIKVWYNE